MLSVQCQPCCSGSVLAQQQDGQMETIKENDTKDNSPPQEED